MRLKDIDMEYGEQVAVQNQWAAEAEKRGTTISNSEWTYFGDGAVISPALTDSLASCQLLATGMGLLKNTVTLASGEILVAYRAVNARQVM